MKRMILGIAMATLFAGSAAANMETDAGSQQLVFSFAGLSNLGAIPYNSGITPSINIPDEAGSSGLSTSAPGGGVGFRHFLSDGTALRAGVDLAFLSESNEPSEGSNKNETSGFAFGVSGALEKFMAPPTARVNPYMGVIGGFGLSSGTFEQTREDDSQNRKYENSAFGFGAGGILGFVAEIFDGVQLGAEYRVGLVLEGGTTEVTIGDNSGEVDTSEFGFGLNAVSFMLSVDLN